MIDFDQLLDEVDLESWLDTMMIDHRPVAGGTNLNLKTCPFCHDERWRVYVSVENKRGLCYHAECNRRFNLWSFARAHLEADNSGTRRHFEDYATRTLGRAPRAPTPRPCLGAEGWELPVNVALPTDEGLTHTYLTERGILPETHRHFDLRWCESGVFNYEGPMGEGKRMWFGGRVLLPIYDLDGQLATFVGRDATGNASMRYLFPPNLPSAARYLYGGNHLPGVEHVVSGEGPFDAIAIYQAVRDHPDFRKIGATATFGLAIGNRQQDGNDQLGRLMRLRESGMKRFTLLWDGERNAFDHACEAGDMLRHALSGVRIEIGLLPAGRDPAEVDTEVVRRAIADAKPVTPMTLMGWRLSSPYR